MWVHLRLSLVHSLHLHRPQPTLQLYLLDNLVVAQPVLVQVGAVGPDLSPVEAGVLQVDLGGHPLTLGFGTFRVPCSGYDVTAC